MIEENPLSYLGFAAIACNEKIEVNMRQMALLTLKSALKRSEDVIEFSAEQLQCLKTLILSLPFTNN